MGGDALKKARKFTVRIFDADADYPTVFEWWQAHGRISPIPAAILPKLGIIVSRDGEDEAALWLYMDNSVGVCFAEYPVTRPKLSLARASAAFAECVAFLKKRANELGYGVMLVRTPPGIARVLERQGFTRGAEGLVCMAALTSVKRV